MNLAFRVDASSQIGIGHLMRCKTLAEGIVDHFDANIYFICRHITDELKNSLHRSGFSLIILESTDISVKESYLLDLSHSHWLGCSQEQDILNVCRVLQDLAIDGIIVDHYSLDYRSETEYKKSVEFVAVIDDLADRKHNCQILVDQNFFVDMDSRYQNLCLSPTKLLLGPKYAMVRGDFIAKKKLLKRRSGKINKILVSLGGADENNYTEMALNAIYRISSEIPVDVVIGGLHKKADKIKAICNTNGYDLHIQTDDMATLMLNSDISIGAAGSTSWERCYLGLPSLCIVQADNQYPIAEGLDYYGAVINLGYGKLLTEDILIKSLVSLLGNSEKLSYMSEKGMQLVDGFGVERIVNEIENLLRK